MNSDELVKVFTMILVIMVIILIVLCIAFFLLKMKSKRTKKDKNVLKNEKNTDKTKENIVKSYSKQSIFKFMEFDKIEDNMIIQKDGKRFLMVVECQGINYDLMSGLEKNSVEQGFLQFLNTLRYPIQIYVQTRTVNLNGSINTYKGKIDDISQALIQKQMEYNQKVRSGQYDARELEKEKYEVIRQKNLYEYGVDIINNTERMSLNRNILSKHYYIIISYYSDELGNNDFAKDEISNIAFSELYTKAQTIINSLSVCGIKSKVLNSTDLAELLYVAYNRDESETLDLKRTLNSGYEELYTTAPNVLDKRMKELDVKAEEEALKKANELIINVVEESEREKRVKRKEKELDELIDQMAIAMIKENRKTVGEDVAEKAINKIKNNKTKEEGGKENEQKTKITRRTTRAV